MNDKTLKELRELAKAHGLRGYSRLTKEQLIRALDQKAAGTRAPAKAAAIATAATSASGRERTTRTASGRVAPGPAAIEPAAPPPADTTVAKPALVAPTSVAYRSTEELVEGAKYALRPNGRVAPAPGTDLNEDIDRLPPLTDPLVCLLPQKPGILHAYWTLPPGETANGDYKLRLCRAANEALEICEEVSVRADRGSWYFHVSEQADDRGLLVQLGYYRDGAFHSARGRSLARLPSLYASARTDERWWVQEQDFMQMYLRAGGFVTPARRFGWTASIGSPGAVAPPAEQHLGWPGGVSSQSK